MLAGLHTGLHAAFGPYAGPAVFAAFVWWFGTGAVLLLNNLPRRSFPFSMAAGTAVLLGAVFGMARLGPDTSVPAAYAAFLCGVLAWAWHEMAFFMGYVTGPLRTGAPPDSPLALRFRLGLAASLWHELAILATAVVVVLATAGAPNQLGAWTFLLLWLMRTSAKLNVVLGVLNLGEVFLPPHLHYLLSFMARRRMNPLMPLSLAGGALGTAVLAVAAAHVGGAGAAGLAMLAAMMALATVEHACLVLPLPFARLWGWFLRFRPHMHAPAAAARPGNRGSGHGLPAVLP